MTEKVRNNQVFYSVDVDLFCLKEPEEPDASQKPPEPAPVEETPPEPEKAE